LIVAAAQVLFLAHRVEDEQAEVSWTRYRPWYRSKKGPSLHDVTWMTREHLYQEDILPIVGFWHTMAEKHRRKPVPGSTEDPRAA
jgi:hypothetical protein